MKLFCYFSIKKEKKKHNFSHISYNMYKYFTFVFLYFKLYLSTAILPISALCPRKVALTNSVRPDQALYNRSLDVIYTECGYVHPRSSRFFLYQRNYLTPEIKESYDNSQNIIIIIPPQTVLLSQFLKFDFRPEY